MFSWEFCEIFKNTFFTEQLRTTASDFLSFIHLIWANQFFLVLSVRCMSDVFLLSGSKKAMMQFQIAFDMIPKIKPARHTSNFQQDSIIRSANLLKRDSDTGVFLWLMRNFLEHLLWKLSVNGCFWKLIRCCYFEFKMYFRCFTK